MNEICMAAGLTIVVAFALFAVFVVSIRVRARLHR